MTLDDILSLLPHRYPFLLIDKVISCEPNVSITALKNVTHNEPFFVGHFPGNPIMPGVLIIEAMAQACCAMVLAGGQEKKDSVAEEKVTLFMGIDNARFRKPVYPGDQLIIDVKALAFRRTICKASCRAFVDEKLVCQAELTASLANKRDLARS